MSPEGSSANPAGAAAPLLRERYELGERVAEGTYFYTHRGRDTQSGRVVAIKVLKPEFAGDETFLARLVAEAQSATSLRHPNIAQVYDAWRERGTAIIVAEQVRGISLKERIRRVAPFPLGVAVDIFLAAAEALHYAHDSGFVHGDLRPDNILITPEGHVKLTDLGLGASVASSTRIQLSVLPDAAAYLAPEVSSGRSADARTDIYALGCTLYEMLAGSVPYAGETPIAVAVKHLHDPVPSLRQANPAVPPAVDGMAGRCMQKDPLSRYITVEALLRDIHRVREAINTNQPLGWSPLAPAVESTPVPTKPRTTPSRRPRQEERAPDAGPSAGLLAGLAVLMVVLIGVSFGVGIALTRTPSETTIPSSLVGMAEAQAVAELERVGLKPELRKEYNDQHPAGVVYRTDPRGGAEVRAGKSVALYISMGPQPTRVPDTVGQDLDDARREVQAAGFALGTITEEWSAVVPKGDIITQTPVGQTLAAKNSPINLVVSKGQEPLPVPTEPEPVPEPVEPEPDPPGPPDEPGTGLPPRDHDVSFEVPPGARGPQGVRIVVQNEDGSEQVAYDNIHRPGDFVQQTVTTYGRRDKCEIRVYLNERLIERKKV